MKTLKQIKEELEVRKAIAHINKEKSDYQKAIKQAQKELNDLKHPSRQVLRNYAKKAGTKLRRVGGTVGRNIKTMGETAYKASKSQAKEIRKNQIRQGYHSNKINYKRNKRVIKRKPKRRTRTRVVYRNAHNPFNPFGLDF